MTARLPIRHERFASRVVVHLSLLAALACSASTEDDHAKAGDAAADHFGDVASETGIGDGGDDRSRVDSVSGSDAPALDIARDSSEDRAEDRAVSDSSGTADDRSEVGPPGAADSSVLDGDSSVDRGDANQADNAADRPGDNGADNSGGNAGDANSDGRDAGSRKPSGVFGGGPFYNDAATVMPIMRASGFTTMVLWSIHVRTNGDLVLNDVPLFSNGSYIGSDAAWPGKVATLKTAPTSVTRVEFSVGAGGTTDFESIESLIGSQGAGPTSILYKNFAALKAAIPVTDAVNFDDESNYDVASTVAFSVMLGDLGYKVTLCPYTNSTFWTSVFNQTNGQRPGLVDRILLQVYAGGAANNPATWSGYFGGLQVEAGLWSRHASNCATGDAPSSVRTKMTNWRSSITGGWMWLLDDMLACDAQYPLEDYAAAINEALNP
ncbi:MAG TPA: hypothetical protein VK550_14710 [Polyangiaceae bacterium]|nr:hypothetical protein [Polyangiaceae bacterium]